MNTTRRTTAIPRGRPDAPLEGIPYRSTSMDVLVSPRRRALLQAMGAAALTAGCGDTVRTLPRAPAALAFSGATMGSTYTVRIAGTAGGTRAISGIAHEAQRAVEGALAQVVGAMSTFDPDSELSRFNRHRALAPFPVSPATARVLAVAREVSEASGGAFDVTVGPAVDAWGFGPRRDWRVPDARTVEAARTDIDYRALALDPVAGTLAKARPGLAADLSGIAKGFGVDEAARALDALGLGDYMVEVGGEVRTRGANPAGAAWQIGVERPDAAPGRVYRVVPLSGLAMATSGDYRNFYEQDGVRYSHEIDPQSGRPVRHALAAVTVVAEDCIRADAWSTALFVLGPAAGYALAAERRLAAAFLSRTAAGLREQQTAAFAALGRSAGPG